MDIVERIVGKLAAESVIEAGAGEGAGSYRLAVGRRYLGFEPDPLSYKVAKDRLDRLASASVINSEVPATPSNSFDVLVALEVLEHLEDDKQALSSWVEWVRPGGWVVVSVPRGPDRFGAMDEAVGHYRRYTRETLTDLLLGAGLAEVRLHAYGMPLGYLLEFVRNRFLAKRLETQKNQRDRAMRSGRAFQPGLELGFLRRALVLPFRYAQRPFEGTSIGIGLVAVAQRHE